jgi:hypothetical protein
MMTASVKTLLFRHRPPAQSLSQPGSAFPLADHRGWRIEGPLLQGTDTAPDRAFCGGSGPR